jgi:hypothetical protein
MNFLNEESEKPHRGTIDTWCVVTLSNEISVVLGVVKDHPTIDDGKPIRTSRVVKLDESQGTLETKNSRYTLGKKSEFNIKPTLVSTWIHLKIKN